MKLSGTNSVNPPVRSWSSRTTCMCSASSQGSSMWPNMTVTEDRRPARCEASMISTQPFTQLVGGRTHVLDHLGAPLCEERGQLLLREPLAVTRLLDRAGHEIRPD